MDIQSAFQLVDRKQASTIECLQGILKVPTVTPPGSNYTELVDYLEPRFQAIGFETRRVVVPQELIAKVPLPMEGPRVNLVASWVTGKPEAVTIYSHMDVVPPGEGWTHDPYGGEVVDGKVYGRGSADMKGNIAPLLTALAVMRELKIEPRYDIHVVLCTDEETGGYPGVRYLAEQGYVKGHVLCMEETQDPTILLGAAGALDVTVTTLGKQCHSGMNFMGVNAIEAMVPILDELMVLKQVVESRASKIPMLPVPPDAPTLWYPMLNLDVINAGSKSNIVPSSCRLVVNRRVIPEETREQAVAEILEAIERGRKHSRALDIKVEVMPTYGPMHTNPASPHAQRMREAYKLVAGFREENFVSGGVGGSTDMGDVQEVLGMDDIVFCGCGAQDSNVHGPDEFVNIRDVMNFAKELVWYLSE
ncbi:MAG TPA: ArgE/DapE family deacylase [Anaerolineales bacterium]|nr:ArgE/DapE family deacylase [Anaerolineales bacterium]